MAAAHGRGQIGQHLQDDGERISRLETTVENVVSTVGKLSEQMEHGFNAISKRLSEREQAAQSERAGIRDSWWKAASVSVTVIALLAGTVGKGYIDPIRTELKATQSTFDGAREDHKETMAVLRDAVNRIAGRVDDMSNRMVEGATKLKLGLHEVETQFQCADNLARLRAANDYQMYAILWGKVFPETALPLPYAPPIGAASCRPHPE